MLLVFAASQVVLAHYVLLVGLSRLRDRHCDVYGPMGLLAIELLLLLLLLSIIL